MIFGGGKSASKTPPETALRIQSSAYGQPIPIGWGQARLAGNLIWYGDFNYTVVQQQSGGKGFGGGGGKGGGGGSYNYTAAVAIGVCAGPIAAFIQCWNTKTAQSLGSLNLTGFLGTYTQTAWSYLTSKHSSQADNYRGIAYVAAGPMQLGSNPELPNLSYEVRFVISNAISGLPDAAPASIVTDFLTNSHYGLGFPSVRIGDLTVYNDYTLALGLVFSPILTNQQAAGSFFQDLMAATNSEAVWSGGVLNIIPYGDTVVTGNGHTYNPPDAAIYSLGDNDVMASQGVSSESSSSTGSYDPIIVTRVSNLKKYNSIPIEYLDRTNSYNPQVVTAKDDASISGTGLRQSDTKSWHFICNTACATTSAHLLLGRQSILNTPAITVGPEYMLLDPMDIIEVNDDAMGMDEQWVRIKEIQENADGSFTLQFEEYANGTGSTPLYGTENASGYFPNYEVDPGPVSPPVLLNPPSLMVQGQLEVWALVAGLNPFWGGCDAYISTDGSSYAYVGTIDGPSRFGELLTTLASHADPDNTNTINVDMSDSLGVLTSTSATSLAAFGTVSMIDQEAVAYQNVSFLGSNQYALTTLRRGLYGTTITSHAAGAQFSRLDTQIFKYIFTKAQIGKTIFAKFCSFNVYRRGLQDISTVTPYPIILDTDGQFYYTQPINDGTVLFTQNTPGAWSFTVPDGIAFLDIYLDGAGGPGGAPSGGKGSAAGYGGGGGARIKHHIAAVKGTILGGTVGTGGKNAANGTATTLTSPSLSAAPGTAAVTSTTEGSGGVATGGNVSNINGHNGGLTNVWDGGGGGSGGGDQTSNNNPGTPPGGGGSGGYYGGPGAGANGQVMIVGRTT